MNEWMKKVAVTRVDKNEFFSDEKELITLLVVVVLTTSIVSQLEPHVTKEFFVIDQNNFLPLIVSSLNFELNKLFIIKKSNK